MREDLFTFQSLYLLAGNAGEQDRDKPMEPFVFKNRNFTE
jgi:hypothetical protein